MKIVDFYFERSYVEAEIKALSHSVKDFGIYIPDYDILAQKTPLK